MSKRILDKKSDVTYLEFLDDIDDKVSTNWNSDSSNEGLFLDSKSEILWSRDKFFTDKDFFHGLSDDSGLTERTTSSCSWHNDEFDMNSCNKVKASLEGIEDALYEQKRSPFISETVFQECSDWSTRFPYYRLKGEQIIKPVDDSVALYSSSQEGLVQNAENASTRLHVEGKKMVIHVFDKCSKKPVISNNVEINAATECLEEIFEFDGEYEECIALDHGEAFEKTSEDLEEELTKLEPFKSIEDKIIDNIAQDMWPMVVSFLQNVGKTNNDVTEDFQLPPIISTIQQQQKLACQRPKTEGTDLLSLDFPSLSSILTISPKLLQNREDGNWKDLRSSRPTSEIHFSRKNPSTSHLRKKHEPLKVSPCLSQLNSFIQVQSLSRKRDEKPPESIHQLLPAVEEDIPDSDVLFEFASSDPPKSVVAKCDINIFSKRGESFLPPIERRSPVSGNVKLTRNLFTLFDPDLKSDKSKEDMHSISRPNTSVSRKASKYAGNLNKIPDQPSNSFSSIETRKLNDLNSDKQVTLFPIVTPLASKKDRQSGRKGPVLSVNNKRKR